LQLKTRTAAPPKKTVPPPKKTAAASEAKPAKPKSNPFGDAKPTDKPADKPSNKPANKPAGTEAKPKSNPFGDAKPTDKPAETPKEKVNEAPAEKEEKKEPELVEQSDDTKSADNKDKKAQREPKVMNSRAAAMGAAPEVKREVRMRTVVVCH
jgi:hypothetical protein